MGRGDGWPYPIQNHKSVRESTEILPHCKLVHFNFLPSCGKACIWKSLPFLCLCQNEGGGAARAGIAQLHPPSGSLLFWCSSWRKSLRIFFVLRMKLPTASFGRYSTSWLGKSSLWIFLVLRGRREKKSNKYSKFTVIALMRQSPLECKHAQQYVQKQSKKKVFYTGCFIRR